MEKYNPNIHHRRSIRLKGYDYSQAGLYFITICTQHYVCLFGHIEYNEMILNDAGKMISNEWLKLPERFNNIKLHEYIIMPNHFHAIIEIVGATLVVAQNDLMDVDNDGQPQGIVPTGNKTLCGDKTGQPQRFVPTGNKTLGDMIGAFKSITTVEYIRGVNTKKWKSFDKKLWQRNYWEHIIRNEKSYIAISDYIRNNPANWNTDKLFVNYEMIQKNEKII